MKQFGKFLAVVAIFGLLVFGIDRLGGFVLSKTIKFGEDAKLKHALNGSSDDMIILGSSRAYHHYNSLLLQKELNLTTYNYGEGGQNIYFYYAEMNMIRSHMPKIVLCELFDIDYTQTPSAWNTDKLSVLYPEYFANDSVRSIIDLQGKNTALKMRLSHLYPYRGASKASKIWSFTSPTHCADTCRSTDYGANRLPKTPLPSNPTFARFNI